MSNERKPNIMRKATGIVRKLDTLRRIVIPIELCRAMDIGEGTPMEIYCDDDEIILQKYEPGCCLCGSSEGKMIDYNKKWVCWECAKKLGREAGEL